MSIRYTSSKKIIKWDPYKTLFENGELLDVGYDQAFNLARKFKLKYKQETYIRKFKCKKIS